MICDRCGLRIMPGDKYDTHIPESMSGARPAAHVHRQLCRRPPTQTAPARIDRRFR